MADGCARIFQQLLQLVVILTPARRTKGGRNPQTLPYDAPTDATVTLHGLRLSLARTHLIAISSQIETHSPNPSFVLCEVRQDCKVLERQISLMHGTVMEYLCVVPLCSPETESVR
jgi:hypothetical protein